ncbi:MAG: sugar phosphate nucleotidyltransferase [Halobacteriota archaeon]
MNDAVSAVVLAAGEGRRLDPLTNRRPKPMVPVANRPLLEYVVEAIADADVDRITLVVGYHRERIRNYFGDGDEWGVQIDYVVQERQLGTAHAVLQAEGVVGEQFLVLNGDRIVESALVEAVREGLSEGTGHVVSVTRSATPSAYGVVELADDSIAAIAEKPDRPVHSELINAGVYGFDSSIFEAIRQTSTDAGELAITSTLDDIAADESIDAIRYRGRWLDVSYLWDLVDVNAAMVESVDRSAQNDEGATVADDAAIDSDVQLGANATVSGGTAIGENATIEANAVLSNSIVFPDAVVESGAVVRNAIVSENARIGANVTIAGGRGTVVVDGELHEDVEFGGVVGDNAVVGGGATIEPGTLLGDGSTVDHGATVGGRIEPDAIVRRG